MCRVIAVSNQKGGVGKTVSCVNLGIGLAKEGKKVLLIDADPQGSLTISLGYEEPDEMEYSLATLMMNIVNDEKLNIEKTILHHKEGVDLIPANIELSAIEVSLVNAMSRELILRSMVDRLREFYDYIIIDCMPSLGMMTINALAYAYLYRRVACGCLHYSGFCNIHRINDFTTCVLGRKNYFYNLCKYSSCNNRCRLESI